MRCPGCGGLMTGTVGAWPDRKLICQACFDNPKSLLASGGSSNDSLPEAPPSAAPDNPSTGLEGLSDSELAERLEAQYPLVSFDNDVMGGSPCVRGTRIPVYMVLLSVAEHGSAKAWYPDLSKDQVCEALMVAQAITEHYGRLRVPTGLSNAEILERASAECEKQNVLAEDEYDHSYNAGIVTGVDRCVEVLREMLGEVRRLQQNTQKPTKEKDANGS